MAIITARSPAAIDRARKYGQEPRPTRIKRALTDAEREIAAAALAGYADVLQELARRDGDPTAERTANLAAILADDLRRNRI
jgi:hypothetical protein